MRSVLLVIGNIFFIESKFVETFVILNDCLQQAFRILTYVNY